MSRLWDKGGSVDQLALAFTVGDDHVLDSKLLPYDLEGTRAHAIALESSGLPSNEERSKIEAALETLREEHARGDLRVEQSQEDCHTAIEARLTDLLGETGAKIHAGRSRNDQVVTMMRLATRDALTQLSEGVGELASALIDLAEANPQQALPGYTHLQRAMPSSVAAWALGYAEVLCEQREAMLSLRQQLGRSALGSAAGYGTPMHLDREAAAQALGFDRVQAVTAVQLTRGLDELRFLQSLQSMGVVISRLAADLVLYATKEFALVTLPAELTTGSSIMPNKANPDLFELLRGRAAVLCSRTSEVSNVLIGLPGGYQRDLQLVKKAFVSGWDEATTLLQAGVLALRGVRFNAEACNAAMAPELYATAYAYHLVREEGLPFREAYRKAAASPEQWKAGFHDESSHAAENPSYCASLADALRQRLQGS